MGRGVVLSGGYDGHAGGAAVRGPDPRLGARRGRPRARCGLRSLGLRRADRGRLRGGHARPASRCSTPRGWGRGEIAAELGGLSPGKLHAADLAADALHRALGAACADAAVPLDAARTLVAMSGGVDSAVAALLVTRAGRDAVAVTLELWRDEENDAAASCCSADAVRLARSVAHRMGMPHFTLDLRAEFRAGVVDPFLAGYAAGETPNPCVGCNGHVRLDAMLELARRVWARRPRHRPLRAGHRRRAAARRRRPGQGPDLHALRALAGVAGADALPAGRADEAGGARAGRRGRAAGRDAAGVPGPVLPRRHGQGALPRAACGPGGRAGEIVSAAGDVRRRAPRLPPLHRRPAQGARRRRRPSRCTSCAPTRRRTASSSARATSSPSDRVPVRGARLHRPGCEVDAVRLRYHSRAVPCRVAGSPAAGPTARSSSSSANPSTAPPPDSPRAFCAATSSSAGRRSRDDPRTRCSRNCRPTSTRGRLPSRRPASRSPAAPPITRWRATTKSCAHRTTRRRPMTTWSGRGRTRTLSTASTGWQRIITQAGPELTWEWLIVDRDEALRPALPGRAARPRARRAGELRGDDGVEPPRGRADRGLHGADRPHPAHDGRHALGQAHPPVDLSNQLAS